MTLKEYMKIHHPEMVDEGSYEGGVHCCPYMYGAFAHMKLSDNCRFNSCTDCWNQEYIPKEGEEMGTKKYIIEIPEETSYIYYINSVRTEYGAVVESKTITLDLLKPYETDALYRDGRRDGQSEVWDFAYEIVDMSDTDRDECFGTKFLSEILSIQSYEEAKEQYDEYAKRKIKPGDEITDGIDIGYALWVHDRKCLAKLNLDDYPKFVDLDCRDFHRTGKHNPKLAEVMKELCE